MRFSLALSLAALAGAGCSYSVQDIPVVPANPTYSRDVHPLLADHCLLCHSSPPSRGAPAVLRLDVYADTGGVLGAKSEAGRILVRVQTNTMPPGAKNGDGVGPNGQKMLQLWVDQGALE